MNALQRLELLSEHAELVQVIPTLKGMTKLDSLERLSQIVELLGGNPYSSDNPHAKYAKDDEHIKQNADNWENRLPQLTTEKVDEYNAKAEPLGYVGDNEPRHAGTGIYNVSKWVDVGDKQYKVSIDGKFKNYGSDESKEKATDFEVYGEIIENGESVAWRDDDGKQYYHTTNDFDEALKQAELWLSKIQAGKDEGADLHNLTQIALTDTSNKLVTVQLSRVDEQEADKLKQATGLDLLDYVHEVDNYAIKHIFKKHGNPKQEESRGQVAITAEDIALIPDIIKNYDKVEYSGLNSSGREVITYSKQYNDVVYYAEEVRGGKKGKRLTTQTMYKRKGSVPQTPETLSAQNRTPGAIPLDENIPNTQPNVNSGALSQAFYDEFMLKNEMGELVFADDEFVDDVDIETHEKALVDGKTYAFGRALIAIDEVVLSRPMWSVVFGDFHHTLMAVSLFDSIANVDDFSVVAQVGVNLNNPKYKQYVLRLAVSDDGNIIAYPNETGDTALRHTIHYSEKDNVRALINTAIQSIENERKQKELLAQKQAKEAQLNAVNLSKKEIEQAFTGLSGVEIGRAKNQLLKTLTTREFGEQTYKVFIETLIDDKGYKPDVANMMKRKGENAGDTKTVYRIANDDGRGYEINKTQYAYAKWYYEQKQAENEPAPQDDESKEPEHSPSNEDSPAALSQNEQQNSPFPPILNKAILDLGLSYVPDSYEKDRVWEYVRNDDNLQNQEMQFMVRILNHQGAGKVSFDIPMNDDEKVEHLRENWTRHNADELVSAMYELFDIYKSHTLAERMKAFEPLQQENTMSEPTTQNPNYTQSDIDYLQSIINGTLDLDTVDMDKMIEIGEKDEHDPMYEQALQVISEYLDKLTSV